MELVFVTHQSLAHIHGLAPPVTYAVLVGAAYGALQMIRDVGRAIRWAVGRWAYAWNR